MRLGQAERGGGEPARTALAGVLFHALDVVHASGTYRTCLSALFRPFFASMWSGLNQFWLGAVLVTPQQQRVRLAEQVPHSPLFLCYLPVVEWLIILSVYQILRGRELSEARTPCQANRVTE